jgi:glycosyltransferase involved in cell wall biosynthesis
MDLEKPMMDVSIIIPALNEEDSIGQVLSEIPAGWACEVLVVDGGSRDGTAVAAQRLGAKVIHEPRRGYGRACATGAGAASGDILVFLDADGADHPRGLPDLVAPLREGKAEMVLGSRLAGQMEAGSMPWHQKAGNQLAAFLFRILYRQAVTDLSPFRAVLREPLAQLKMQEMTYGWPVEMMARAFRQGWRVLEIPVGYRRRLGGRSKISGTPRGTLLATWFIMKVIFRYAGWKSLGVD